MCRCGIDSRVSRPICRKCHGCEDCGCICQAVEFQVRHSLDLLRAVPCPTCKESAGRRCHGLLHTVHKAREERAVIAERRRVLAL